MPSIMPSTLSAKISAPDYLAVLARLKPKSAQDLFKVAAPLTERGSMGGRIFRQAALPLYWAINSFIAGTAPWACSIKRVAVAVS